MYKFVFGVGDCKEWLSAPNIYLPWMQKKTLKARSNKSVYIPQPLDLQDEEGAIMIGEIIDSGKVRQ